MSSVRRRGAALIAAAVLAGSGVLAAAPAYAYTADCTHGLYTATSGGYKGRSKPVVSCGTMDGAQARARADCTLAPDTYTAWVRAWQSSSGGYCLFGARTSILETRAG